ncbi:MAG: divalent-cation tolerance protein CutA [Micrococcales bacterium]|nr:divalent-cation tolerance protein CutA [Micrococcales bacterium]
MTEALEVHITTPDSATAERIARLLVEERLAACAQVLPDMTSYYRWDGVVQADPECLILAKTTPGRFDELAARVEQEHPYETPEVIAMPIVAATEAYAAWLAEAVTRPPE